MKTALTKRLERLEEVRVVETQATVEFQVGFVKRLPAEYTGDHHLVTDGRDPAGLYHWEDRPGPEPNKGKRNSVQPFRVVLASPEDVPASGA